jgi:hypothetical protein
MFSLVDDVELDVLGDGAFPEVNVAPNGFVLDELEQVLLVGLALAVLVRGRLEHDVEGGGQDVAVDRDGGVGVVVVLIEHNGEQLPQLEQSLQIHDLEQPLHSELVEDVDEQLLPLLVPHDLREPSQVVLPQHLLPIPGFEQDLVDVNLKASVELSVQRFLI